MSRQPCTVSMYTCASPILKHGHVCKSNIKTWLSSKRQYLGLLDPACSLKFRKVHVYLRTGFLETGNSNHYTNTLSSLLTKKEVEEEISMVHSFAVRRSDIAFLLHWVEQCWNRMVRCLEKLTYKSEHSKFGKLIYIGSLLTL